VYDRLSITRFCNSAFTKTGQYPRFSAKRKQGATGKE
jgi:hypothetical protein